MNSITTAQNAFRGVAAWLLLLSGGVLLFSGRLVAAPPGEGLAAPEKHAQELVHSAHDRAALEAALSIDLVAVDTDFLGADLLLFGSAAAGSDIVVAVRGPATGLTVRRKQRRAGIWVNAEEHSYENVPSYYYLAANRPLAAFVSPEDRQRFGLDLESIDIKPVHTVGPSVDVPSDFSQGLITQMRIRGFYGQAADGVTFLGSRLFRVDLRLPPDVPVGTFMVDIYGFRDGVLHAVHSTQFLVGKIGIGAALYSFAHRHPVLYGLVAVVLAIGLGGLSALIFRKF